MTTAPSSGPVCDVLGMGANSVDYVYLLPAYPEADGPNAKMRISSHSLSCGGQVATALCTCAAMGLRAKYIGATGTDDNGRRLRDELAKRHIDMSDAVIRDVTNQFAVIMVDEHAGERIVLWDRHDGLALRPREAAAGGADVGARAARGRRRSGGRDSSRVDCARGGRAGDERHRSNHAEDRGARVGRHDADFRRARAEGARPARRISNARSGSCVVSTTVRCASRSARAARCCSTAIVSIRRRPSRSKPSTQRAPAMSFVVR